MKGRLNLFQCAMLRWRTLHPYIAVHAAFVEGMLDVAKLERAIGQTLEHEGLTGYVLDARRKRYEWRGGPPNVALAASVADDADARLDDEIARQLNAPFPAEGAYEPFRWFAIRDARGFYVGIAYDHIVAGGDCLIAMLDMIVRRYRGVAVDEPRFDRYPPRYARLFGRHLGAMPRNLRALRAAAQSCRRSVRPRYRDIEEGTNGFVRHTLEPPEFAELRAAAKSLGVTLNDLLLALLLAALGRRHPDRDPASKRHEIAVASIMNLRAAFGLPPRTAFAPFLGSMRIAHPVPRDASLATIARDVHALTGRIKRDRLFLQNLLGVAANAFIWRFHNHRQRCAHFAKSYPVLAGLSALNVSDLWKPAGETGPIYVRGVSTGPVAPIVLAVTTSADRLQAGLSYRTSAMTTEEINKIWADVQDNLRQLR